MSKKENTIFGIIMAVILLVVIVILFVIFNQDKNISKPKTFNEKETKEEILLVLKKDYEFLNLVYGKPEVLDSFITDNGLNYYCYSNKEIKNTNDIYSMAKEIYITRKLKITQGYINNYNKFLGFGKNLYININPKCEMQEFDKNIKIFKHDSKKVLIDTGDKQFYVYYQDGKYKLEYSPYECE